MTNSIICQIILIICSLIQSFLTILNMSILNVMPSNFYEKPLGIFVIFCLSIVQYIIYNVLVRIYTGGYFYFFLDDENEKDTNKQLKSYMGISFITFIISGIIYILFAVMNPSEYKFFILGKANDGKRAFSQIVLILLGIIQGSIVFLLIRKWLTDLNGIKRLLRFICLILIFSIVHLPGLIKFFGA